MSEDPFHQEITDRTATDQAAAVLRSIRCIRENVGAPHSLRGLASVALFSPYHFHRMFRQLTASTPAQFLAAIRMAEAKRLLASTTLSVTEVCMRVGYASLGTFTTQFTRLVGVSPRRFRRLFDLFADRTFASLLAEIRAAARTSDGVTQVTGAVSGGPVDALAAVGLFATGIPRGHPASCAIVPTPGIAGLGGLVDGEYRMLAMSFDERVTIAMTLLDDAPGMCFVGAGRTPIRIHHGRGPQRSHQVKLRARRPTDPPVVLALPLLIAAELGPGSKSVTATR